MPELFDQLFTQWENWLWAKLSLKIGLFKSAWSSSFMCQTVMICASISQCSKYMFDEYLVCCLISYNCTNARVPFVPNSLYMACLIGSRYWICFSWLIPQFFYLNLRVSQNSCKNARLPFAPYSLPGFSAETGSASTGVATRIRLRGPG